MNYLILRNYSLTQYPKINMDRIEKTGLIIFCLLAIVLTYWVKDNSFFWDTVQLGSLHAHFYFENDFKTMLLPTEMDSGHPPFFGMYLAFCWKIFGKSLAVSHFAMLPFLLGTVLLLFNIGKQFFSNASWILVLVTLVFFDPCWIGQAAMITPDIVLAFSFLLALNGILQLSTSSNSKIANVKIVIGIIGLCLISMRGMMVAAAICLFDYLNYFLLEKKKFSFQAALKKTLPYWVGALLGFAFLIFHYVKTGWIGYHEDSPWAPLFARVGLKGMIRNVGILIWRILDFGRLFLVVILLLGGWEMFFQKVKLDDKIKQILLLLGLLFLFLTPSFILHKDLSGHRYLLPIFLVIDLLAVYIVFLFFRKNRFRNILIGAMILGLSTGNLWIYPKTIAQSWDSTLAHVPYFELRNKMIEYLDNEKIPIESVGTVYPNLATFELIDLNGINKQFPEADLKQHQYIFYSNVYNDFSDNEIVLLEKEWKVIKEFRKNRISVVLYGK